MPKPTSTKIGEKLNVDNGLDSQAGASHQDLGISEAHSLALEALSWLFEEDEKSPPSKLEDVRSAQLLLDGSPTKHLLGQTEKKDEGCSWSQELHGCELLGNEVWQSQFLLARSVRGEHHLFNKVAEQFPVEQKNGCGIHEKWMLADSFPRNSDSKDDATQAVADIRSSKLKFNALVVFMFDPGGSSWNCNESDSAILLCSKSKPEVEKFYHKMPDEMPMLFSIMPYGKIDGGLGTRAVYNTSCAPIQFNTFDTMPNQLSKNFQLEQEYCEPANMKNVELNEIQEVVFIFDPGIRSWILSCASVNPYEMSSHSNAESWVERVVFLFDPGGHVCRSSILRPLRIEDLVDEIMVKQPLVIYVLASCDTYYLLAVRLLNQLCHVEAMDATQLNIESRIGLYNALQVEFLATFVTVKSWKGSGGSTTTSVVLSRKNWGAFNAFFIHLTQGLTLVTLNANMFVVQSEMEINCCFIIVLEFFVWDPGRFGSLYIHPWGQGCFLGEWKGYGR